MEHLPGYLFRLVLYIAFLPVCMTIATTIILLGAAFSGEGPYLENVKNGYGTVYHHWDRLMAV